MNIVESKKEGEIDIATKVLVQIQSKHDNVSFNQKVIKQCEKNTFYDATDLMNDAVAAGKTVIRYPITGYWLDIGSHEEYKKANELVKHIKK